MIIETKYDIGQTLWGIGNNIDYDPEEFVVMDISTGSNFIEKKERTVGTIFYDCCSLENWKAIQEYPELTLWHRTFTEGKLFLTREEAEEALIEEYYKSIDESGSTIDVETSGFTEDIALSGITE